MNWIFVFLGAVALLIALLYFLEKLKHYKTKTLIVIVIIFLLFFYLTGSRIIKENNIDIKTFNGIATAGKLYFVWLGNAFSNVKTLTGNVVKMNWQGNSTGT